jgi:hypothetical protein
LASSVGDYSFSPVLKPFNFIPLNSKEASLYFLGETTGD